MPGRSPTPAVTHVLNRCKSTLRFFVRITGDEYLVEDDVIVDGEASLMELTGEVLCMGAELFYQCYDPLSTQCLKDGPKLDGPSSLGHGGRVTHRFPFVTPLEILRRSAKRSFQRRSIPAQNDTAVVRDVQRLVSVNRP